MKNKRLIIFKLGLFFYAFSLFAPKNNLNFNNASFQICLHQDQHKGESFKVYLKQDRENLSVSIVCLNSKVEDQGKVEGENPHLIVNFNCLRGLFEIHSLIGRQVEDIFFSYPVNFLLKNTKDNQDFDASFKENVSSLRYFLIQSYVFTIPAFLCMLVMPLFFNSKYFIPISCCFLVSLALSLSSIWNLTNELIASLENGFFESKGKIYLRKDLFKFGLKPLEKGQIKLDLGHEGFLRWNQENINYLEKLLWDKKSEKSLFPEDIRMIILSFLGLRNSFEYLIEKYCENNRNRENKEKLKKAASEVLAICLDKHEFKE